MSAPALLIVLPLEGQPRVVSTATTEGEQLRIEDMLRNADEATRDLLERAFDLAERRAA